MPENVSRRNTSMQVLPSAARTASVDSATFDNYGARGLHLIIDVSAISATPSLTFKIQGVDATAAGGPEFYDLLTSVAITAAGTTVLKLYPGLTAVTNVTASDILPARWRVSVTAADADSATYSVHANLVV